MKKVSFMLVVLIPFFVMAQEVVPILPELPVPEEGDSLLSIVIKIVGFALSGFLVWIGNEFRRWISAKIKNEQLKNALVKAEIVIEHSVNHVGATVVDDLKRKAKDGRLTQAEAKEAAGKAKDAAKALLGDGLTDIVDLLGGKCSKEDKAKKAEKFLDMLVETKVLKRKK